MEIEEVVLLTPGQNNTQIQIPNNATRHNLIRETKARIHTHLIHQVKAWRLTFGGKEYLLTAIHQRVLSAPVPEHSL